MEIEYHDKSESEPNDFLVFTIEEEEKIDFNLVSLAPLSFYVQRNRIILGLEVISFLVNETSQQVCLESMTHPVR